MDHRDVKINILKKINLLKPNLPHFHVKDQWNAQNGVLNFQFESVRLNESLSNLTNIKFKHFTFNS